MSKTLSIVLIAVEYKEMPFMVGCSALMYIEFIAERDSGLKSLFVVPGEIH